MARKSSKAQGFFGKSNAGDTPDPAEVYQGVEAGLVHRLVTVAVDAGGAVLFGTTRDRTAATLRLYLGSEAQTFYAGDAHDLEDLLRHWIEQYEGVAEEREKPSGGRQGPKTG